VWQPCVARSAKWGGGDGRVNSPRRCLFSMVLASIPPFFPRRRGCHVHLHALSPEGHRAVRAVQLRLAHVSARHVVEQPSNPRGDPSSESPLADSPVTHALLTHGAFRGGRTHLFLADPSRPLARPRAGLGMYLRTVRAEMRNSDLQQDLVSAESR
jgi:hypothetical protein